VTIVIEQQKWRVRWLQKSPCTRPIITPRGVEETTTMVLVEHEIRDLTLIDAQVLRQKLLEEGAEEAFIDLA